MRLNRCDQVIDLIDACLAEIPGTPENLAAIARREQMLRDNARAANEAAAFRAARIKPMITDCGPDQDEQLFARLGYDR